MPVGEFLLLLIMEGIKGVVALQSASQNMNNRVIARSPSADGRQSNLAFQAAEGFEIARLAVGKEGKRSEGEWLNCMLVRGCGLPLLSKEGTEGWLSY